MQLMIYYLIFFYDNNRKKFKKSFKSKRRETNYDLTRNNSSQKYLGDKI